MNKALGKKPPLPLICCPFTKGAIAWQIEVELCNPKTPYEQGKKEALSWCIGGD